MKKIVGTILAGLLCSLMLAAQTLEIHQLDVGQADAAVIIAKDPQGNIAKTVLLDGGRYNRDMNTIKKFFINHQIKEIDYMINTHFDADHVGGLRNILRNPILSGLGPTISLLGIDTVFDRGDEYPTRAYNSNISRQFRALAGSKRDSLEPGTTFFLYDDPNNVYDIVMICVAVNGRILTGLGGNDNAIDLLENIPSPDENDLSAAFLIEYGEFSYFTGGDIGGKNSQQPGTCDGGYTCNFTDIETDVTEYVNHTCAFKVNHHGSRCSTNNTFLDILYPKVAIISSGKHRGFKHPRQEVLNALNTQDGLAHYYITAGTNYYKRAHNKGSFEGGTVSIIVNKSHQGVDITNESRFTVQGTNYICNNSH